MNLERERERERETLRGWRPALRSRAWRSRTSSPSLLLLLLSTVADHEEEEDSRIGWELSPLLPLLLLLLLSDSFFSTTNSIFNFFFSKALVFSLSLSLSLSLHPDWTQERKKWKQKKIQKNVVHCSLSYFFFFLGWANEILLYTSRLQGWKFPTRPGPYYWMSKSFTPNKICLGRAVICAVDLKIRNFRYISLLVFLTFFLISLRVLRIFGILKRKNSRLILHWKMSVS